MLSDPAVSALHQPTSVRVLDGGARANLERAFRRALAEGLVAYPQTAGRWMCKTYALHVKGPSPLAVECECADAVYRDRLCKHAACVVFCRLYGFIPCPPAGADGRSRLPDCLEEFVMRAMGEVEAAA